MSSSRTETKTVPERGRSTPAPSCDLAKASAKSVSRPMTSPVDFISGPSSVSTPGKRAKGKHGFLDRDVLELGGVDLLAVMGEGGVEAFAGHDARRDLGDRAADGLGDEGHGARGARVDFEDVDLAVLDRELHVHQAADLQRDRHAPWPGAPARRPCRLSACRPAASRRCRPNGCRPPRYAA